LSKEQLNNFKNFTNFQIKNLGEEKRKNEQGTKSKINFSSPMVFGRDQNPKYSLWVVAP